MILLAQFFPYLLVALLPAAILFHPIQGARSVLFFIFGYFLTTALYSLGFFEDYGTRYHPLIFASVITIVLYHSLDVTPYILVAWITELFLIGLNAMLLFGAGITPSLHWQLTVGLNAFSLLVLLLGWFNGTGRILYGKRFSLDLPLGFVGHGYRLVSAEGQTRPRP